MDADVYSADDNDTCDRCGDQVAWSHLVDQTNDEGHPIKLEVLEKRTCPCCNTALETTFKRPNADGVPTIK
jgi:hypothetical protein